MADIAEKLAQEAHTHGKKEIKPRQKENAHD
jgi:hypothetical protein